MDFVSIELPWKPIKVLFRGPTGAGKTMNGLRVASYLAQGKDIAFLDSESGRGQLMARSFKFKYASLSGNYNPTKYVEAINSAISAGFGAIVLDSLTQAWNGVGGLLDQVNAKGGNSFTDGWGKIGTPLQNKLMDAIITSPIPVICTVRSKMGYEISKDDRGKSVPKAIGLAPEQRDNLSYEFDVVLDVTMDHESTVAKMPPVDGLESSIAADQYVAWFTKVAEWLQTGVISPQTWTDIKSRTLGDSNRTELARQLFAAKKTIAEAWEILKNEPVNIDGDGKKPATEVGTEVTWGTVMQYATDHDKTAKDGEKGILTGKAKALRTADKTPVQAMAELAAIVKSRSNGVLEPA